MIIAGGRASASTSTGATGSSTVAGWSCCPVSSTRTSTSTRARPRRSPTLERIADRPVARRPRRDLQGSGGRPGASSPTHVEAIAAAVLTESLLGGVTTVADQHYFHPAGPTLALRGGDDRAAAESSASGCTRAAARSPSVPIPTCVQSIDEVVRHCAALIAAHHDPAPVAHGARRARAVRRARRRARAVRRAGRARRRPRRGPAAHASLREGRHRGVPRERYGTHAVGVPRRARLGRSPARGSRTSSTRPRPRSPEMAAAGVAVAHLIAPDLRMGWGSRRCAAISTPACTRRLRHHGHGVERRRQPARRPPPRRARAPRRPTRRPDALAVGPRAAAHARRAARPPASAAPSSVASRVGRCGRPRRPGT